MRELFSVLKKRGKLTEFTSAVILGGGSKLGVYILCFYYGGGALIRLLTEQEQYALLICMVLYYLNKWSLGILRQMKAEAEIG